MSSSRNQFDLIFRRTLLLSKVFTKSWGSPEVFKLLKYFRDNYMYKRAAMELIERKMPKMIITKEWITGGVQFMEGRFRSPLAECCPDLFVDKVDVAVWKGLFPAPGLPRNGLVVLLSGTGDHTFTLREWGFANDLVKSGVSSIMLVNPFYDTRKPEAQFRSSLLNVSDLFVMGGALMTETCFLLEWAREMGHHPVGLAGVSMGGYNASLSATNVPQPVALVPCLSWTTAAPSFTEGALADAVQWQSLEHELNSPAFRKAIEDIPCDWFERLEDGSCPRPLNRVRKFMWILMEEFTNLSRYPVPLAPDLVKSVVAEADAYILREDVPGFTEIWPGSSVHILPNRGHVQSFFLEHGLFRRTVLEMLAAAQQRQPLDATSLVK